ncbi:MAG: DUF2911 domain-containing protein [Saprospiraceae bacterium]|nr:DUF2911 domain-containing protein [Saprospiraceae bacterium]
MKTIIILISLLPAFLIAQIDLPPASPFASWTHQLGFTQIDLSYSRPHMRGRKIFGALVPYNVIWRTGAGESTRIKFSEDIQIGGQPIQKGQYALYSIPGPDEWTIILNADATLHGDFGYDEKKDILRFKVKPTNSPTTHESFTIELIDFKSDYSAVLQLRWENTIINIPIVSNADSKIMAQIQENLMAQKVENAGLLYKGAQYYFFNKKDLNQALLWSEKAQLLAVDNFNYILLTTKILEGLKRYPDAIQSAEKALELAKKKDMVDESLQLEQMIAEWKITNKNK